MHLPFRVLCTVFLSASLAGCAAPRYQTIYRYEAPADQQGRACLENCQGRLSSCQEDCSNAFKSCMNTIEPVLKERYAEALKHYVEEVERYTWDIRHYEMQFWPGWGHGSWYGAWPYQGWPGSYWYPYPPPIMPSREVVLDRLRKEKCVEDCGCLNNYDACFLGCGGKRVPEVKCLGNCLKQD
jgi:hypothetical protein